MSNYFPDRIKRNYNEGRWVTCAAVCIIPVLAAWAIVYYFAPVTLHDPTNAVCILIIGEAGRELVLGWEHV